MYIWAETLHRDESDNLSTWPVLLNTDHALRIEPVRRSGTTPVVIQVHNETGSSSDYYFGPHDMTDDELRRRLHHLHNVIRDGRDLDYTKARDDAARKAGQEID
jgi:hypothetical protein